MPPEERLKSIEESIRRIELALIGNHPLGHRGIVERLGDVEHQVSSHNAKLLTWGGIVIGASSVIAALTKYIFGK